MTALGAAFSSYSERVCYGLDAVIASAKRDVARGILARLSMSANDERSRRNCSSWTRAMCSRALR